LQLWRSPDAKLHEFTDNRGQSMNRTERRRDGAKELILKGNCAPLTVKSGCFPCADLRP
jgi:hypothetical protein